VQSCFAAGRVSQHGRLNAARVVDAERARQAAKRGREVERVYLQAAEVAALAPVDVADRRLSIAAADGTGVAQELPCPGAYCEPTDWSPDGRHLIVNTRLATIGARSGDVWSVSLETGGSAKAILSGPFPEYDARISPNGQWLAYVSEEAGRPEVSVRSMSGPPSRLVVSIDGGS